jgi:AcrR family transcriptional regulator
LPDRTSPPEAHSGPGAAEAAGTRERLLEAAERLVAEHGFRATSLRRVTAAADANLAAVNYHFGSKVELVAEVYRRILGEVNRTRLRRLDAEERRAGPGAPDLETVLGAFLDPALELRATGRGRTLQRLMVRLHSEAAPEILERVMADLETVFRRFTAVIARACPHLSPAQVALRLRLTVGCLAFAIHDGAFRGFGSARPERVDPEIRRQLVAFTAAGFRAPAAPRPPEKTT